jgi:hypothetical protein
VSATVPTITPVRNAFPDQPLCSVGHVAIKGHPIPLVRSTPLSPFSDKAVVVFSLFWPQRSIGASSSHAPTSSMHRSQSCPEAALGANAGAPLHQSTAALESCRRQAGTSVSSCVKPLLSHFSCCGGFLRSSQLCRCTRSPLVPLCRPLSLHHLQITGEPPPPHRRPFLVQGGLHGFARWMRGASLMLIVKTLRSLVTHRTTAGHIAPAPSSRSKHQHRVLCVNCSPPPPPAWAGSEHVGRWTRPPRRGASRAHHYVARPSRLASCCAS